ncbi:TetR/AcrR family transcriptional regulator [Paenibacillus glycanilyticus]|uniref:TetR family transcriptional regulator n=1 Tax=Paenibacillus glycanilyticus TaxID=126569 RepID=A0ABQ6GBP8_9BACL|nr:TetR/AcrR family transcriptional regulator [Paenibacillus glycanilyticus]GLX67935.1 TetR family transcriptional regulator [Paenibacillus glycanilyticus]
MNREEKKLETKNRILDAAMRLFAEQGFEATTVAQITEAAGVAKGTFFNYFKTKEDVRGKLDKIVAMDEIVNLKDKPGPYAPRFIALIKKFGDSMAGNQSMLLLSIQGMLANNQNIEESKEGFCYIVDCLVPIFEKGQQTGEFTTTIPAETMAHIALKIFLGVMINWAMGLSKDDFGDQLLLSYQVFFEGVMKK